MTAQKDAIKDITSDSQMTAISHTGGHRLVEYLTSIFYLFLYLYITTVTINNDTPYLKSPKNQNRRAAINIYVHVNFHRLNREHSNFLISFCHSVCSFVYSYLVHDTCAALPLV